ncbi:uncharacterized protein Z519_03413 [Cladophialophora bantiana CBS 173.52]|uniref:Uncharacterized protein n=1 Tax=Cladophialophora bantiana (strain ATCC 10958 / CBS 173.52 / CDC B-1940 / NIH 8579) TaxID=1442370 RepID=A0A0D2IHY0_CLAB1|nr:uncharacterized protein Z519_03413 [Cladophialophora bantiana CBS 173.52]KIW96344.1 hypothetical protein Z519_03413 [Cladophialophora bantiana CBS 173.52]
MYVLNTNAANADVETMHILRQMDFTGIPFEDGAVADANDGDKSPGLSILSTRSDCSVELIGGFQSLARVVRLRRGNNNDIKTDGEEELCEDAPERLQQAPGEKTGDRNWSDSPVQASIPTNC